MSQLSTHEPGLESLDALQGVEALCLFVAEDDRPLPGTAGYVDWRLCGALSRLLQAGFFTGKRSDWLLLPSDGKLPVPRIFAVGVGQRRALDAETLGEVMSEAAEVLSRARMESVALEVPEAKGVDEAARARALLERFLPGFSRGKGRVAVLAERALASRLPSSRRG